jgi:hypothetical protein
MGMPQSSDGFSPAATNSSHHCRLPEVAGFCKPKHDIETFHALRLADPDDFVFLDLAFRCDLQLFRKFFPNMVRN